MRSREEEHFERHAGYPPEDHTPDEEEEDHAPDEEEPYIGDWS